MKSEKKTWIAPGAVCMGDVILHENASIWYNAVVRADADRIEIGKGVNIQDGAIIHTDEGFPVSLGDGVSVGHGAIVHGSKVGENTLIGMGAILMNGSSIGKNSLVAAGALIPEGKTYPDGSLILGSPAKVIRSLSEKEVEQNRKNAEEYIQLAARQMES